MIPQVLLFAMTLAAAAFRIPAMLVPDAVIARIALELLQRVGAADEMEQAAFVIRTPAGKVELLPWRGRGHYTATWKGPVPAGVIAVIHTHPNERPMPSAQDRAEAKRLRLPFYVVSRGALCFADATNRIYCARQVPWLMRNAAFEALKWAERIAM